MTCSLSDTYPSEPTKSLSLTLFLCRRQDPIGHFDHFLLLRSEAGVEPVIDSVNELSVAAFCARQVILLSMGTLENQGSLWGVYGTGIARIRERVLRTWSAVKHCSYCCFAICWRHDALLEIRSYAVYVMHVPGVLNEDTFIAIRFYKLFHR